MSQASNEINQFRIDKMIELLNNALQPSSIAIQDDSHLHAGHAGATTGKAHFTLEISSKQFSGLPPLKRHQLVYQALAEMMQTDIHALVIKART